MAALCTSLFSNRPAAEDVFTVNAGLTLAYAFKPLAKTPQPLTKTPQPLTQTPKPLTSTPEPLTKTTKPLTKTSFTGAWPTAWW